VKLIRQHRFDTVLSFLLHANAVAAAASPLCPGVRFLQSIQTTQPHPHWHWTVQGLAQHAAQKIVVPTPSVAEVAMRWSHVPAEKIIVIPNGIDLPASPPVMHAAGEAGHPHRVVFIGRLDPVKRLPDLLKAIGLLQGFARLDIYGEGSQRGLLEKLIQVQALSGLVTLHGSITTPRDALRQAEALVLPSEAEGFGLVLIEAMAAGVPVVATIAPGIRDVVRHGVTGLLVPIGSPPELAAAIRTVLEDQKLRQSLVAAAFADVRRRFTWDSVIGEYRRCLRV
jgi:2-deoxystreptamine N-acetyl-D-glucosaminyltransferase/2-deoxystreptamine glucosyltransferase